MENEQNKFDEIIRQLQLREALKRLKKIEQTFYQLKRDRYGEQHHRHPKPSNEAFQKKALDLIKSMKY